jgi:hypothetical protein
LRLSLPILAALLLATLPSPAADPAISPSPAVDFAHLPWSDGEALTYLVSCYGVDAAEGTFTAHNKSDHWEFDLQLASKGWIDTVYPFSGYFWSILAPGPWRSAKYGEFRFEPHRQIREETTIDYGAHQGRREIWAEGKTKTFKVKEDAIDDVGTMLYHLRIGSWQPGQHRTIFVYESNSEKQADAACQARETRAIGTWPAQPLLRFYVLPTVGTHHRGHLTIWMTDDARRLPLEAEIAFKYGSFMIDLEKASPPVKSP